MRKYNSTTKKQHRHISSNTTAGGRLQYRSIVNKTNFLVPSSIAEDDADITDVPGIDPSESIVIGIIHDYILKKVSFE